MPVAGACADAANAEAAQDSPPRALTWCCQGPQLHLQLLYLIVPDLKLAALEADLQGGGARSGASLNKTPTAEET